MHRVRRRSRRLVNHQRLTHVSFRDKLVVRKRQTQRWAEEEVKARIRESDELISSSSTSSLSSSLFVVTVTFCIILFAFRAFAPILSLRSSMLYQAERLAAESSTLISNLKSSMRDSMKRVDFERDGEIASEHNWEKKMIVTNCDIAAWYEDDENQLTATCYWRNRCHRSAFIVNNYTIQSLLNKWWTNTNGSFLSTRTQHNYRNYFRFRICSQTNG